MKTHTLVLVLAVLALGLLSSCDSIPLFGSPPPPPPAFQEEFNTMLHNFNKPE